MKYYTSLLSAILFFPMTSAAGDYTMLKVNGQEIPHSHVISTWNNLFPGDNAPDFDSFDDTMRHNVLRGIIGEHLIYQEAVASGIENNPRFRQELEAMRKKLLSEMYLQEKTLLKVTDDRVRDAYEKRVAKLEGTQEIRARHILVKTETEAQNLKKRIDKGEPFARLAQKYSLDKTNAGRGGDLGYFGPHKMVPAFTDAAFALEKGEVSAPVKTSFGWHLIRREAMRDVEIPAYEEVEASIRRELEEKTIRNYVHDLVDKADVALFNKQGRKQEFTRMPDKTR